MQGHDAKMAGLLDFVLDAALISGCDRTLEAAGVAFNGRAAGVDISGQFIEPARNVIRFSR